MFKKYIAMLAASGLVIGNLVGVGILALPVGLGMAGIFPSLLSITLYSLMMLYTAEVIAREAVCAKNSIFDYPSLYGHYLGKAGKWLAIIVNAFILYGFLIAYICCASKILADVCPNIHIPAVIILTVSAVLIFITVVNIKLINKYNTLLIILLFACFIGLIVFSSFYVNPDNYTASYWNYFGLTIPLVVTAAHFHNIIPKLCCDLNWEHKLLTNAIIIGMVAATVMNIVWMLCGVGCLSRLGENGIINSYILNLPATVPMRAIIGSATFTIFGVLFSVIAIATSFLANGLGLMNFVRDILQNSFNINREILVKFIAFVPPVIFALLCPNIFIKTLNVVGGIGIVTLFGILPCLIAILKKENSLRFKIVGVFFLILSLVALLIVIGSICGVEFLVPNPANELYNS